MRNSIFGLALLLLGTGAHATSTGKAPWDEYGERIKKSESVAPLGNNAAGDEVSLADGTLSFSAVDVSIPGNNSLPVEFRRRYSVRDQRHRATTGMVADWEIDVPHISGVFLGEWLATGGTQNRCTDHGVSPATGGVLLSDYWNGTQVNIPGVGGSEMLTTTANTTVPGTGGPYSWIAGNQIAFSCLEVIQNEGGTDKGQGYLAVTPDGTKYWFDVMARTPEPILRRGSVRDVHGAPAQTMIPRWKYILYASKVQDRFGNTVTYTYSNAWNSRAKLTQISSSDGRQLTITYGSNNYVSTVTDGTRTWSYAYATTPEGRPTLSQVTLPDTTFWSIAFQQFTDAELEYAEEVPFGEPIRSCTTLQFPDNLEEEQVGSITHPSGVTATFTTSIVEHGRNKVTVDCGNWTSPGNDPNDDVNRWPISYHAFSLKSKQLSGPGLTAATWNYAYASNRSVHRYPGTTFIKPVCVADTDPVTAPNWNCSVPYCHTAGAVCDGVATTTVTGPNNEWTRYTYGNNWRTDEGKLKAVEAGSIAGGTPTVLRTTTNSYDLTRANQIYPAAYGTGRKVNGESYPEEYHRPQTTRSIVQQGRTFTRSISAFDYFARPLTENVGGRTELTEYEDSTSAWVLGQVKKRTVAGFVTESTTFNAAHLPYELYANGLKVQTLTYNPDGTIATAKDGRGNITTVSNWYRGVPRNVLFADGQAQQATVSAAGFVTSVTDENGWTTSYGYDAIGRMTSLTPPTGDTVAWTPTTIAYSKVASTEYGIPAGHWRQVVTRGNYRKAIYFDALWRPVIEREYDNAAPTATQRFRGFRYDHEGRASFVGYPLGSASGIGSFTLGTETVFDALGRPLEVRQDTEYGTDAVTAYAYNSDFKTRITNPRGYWTETEFRTWDEPVTDFPISIVAAGGQAEQQTTTIARDPWGKPTSVERSGTYGGSIVSLARSYVYDANHRLCKRIEPETGAAIVDYDAAQNIAWSTEGSALTGLTCDRTSVAAADRSVRTYDLRNRLTLVNHPTGTPDITTTYFDDGKVESITSGTSVTIQYQYNRRGLMTSERLLYGTIDWQTNYTYNVLGDLATMTYDDGHAVAYAPNALGQPSQAGTWATGVSYFPNGAVNQFTYGNGIVHTLTQNARQLPERSRDALGATAILDDTYDYDFNGNVAAITDGLPLAHGNREFDYDALDRLVGVVATAAAGGNATFAYDPLDNLRIANQGARAFRYHYDAANLLQTLKTPGGATLYTFGYDSRGNQTSKTPSGQPTQTFTFNRANQLTDASAGVTNFVYDGLGRRAKGGGSSAAQYFYYGRSGQQLFSQDTAAGGNRRSYVYLAGSLIARRSQPNAGGQVTATYLHTDALGSPVIETNASGGISQSREWLTVWGEPVSGSYQDGPGYTGHQTDTELRLSYMQQRYYDPGVGRFLSADPVRANPASGTNFNRYWYGNNNPVKFVDPDGRYACIGSPSNCGKVDKFVSGLKAAVARMAPSVSQANLAVAVGKIGNFGDPGITFYAGNSGPQGQNAPGGRINLNISKIEASARALAPANSRLLPAQLAVAVGASTIAHEMNHDFDRHLPGLNPGWFPRNREVRRQTEINAYRVESDLAPALGIVTGLNMPGMSEADRRSAIQAAAEDSVKSACAGIAVGTRGC